MAESAFTARYLGPYLVHVFPDPDGFWAIMIPSSQKKSGQDDYTVIRERTGSLACDCKSFMYRYSCRHVQLVKEVLP